MSIIRLFEKFNASGFYPKEILDRKNNLQLINLSTGLVLLKQCACSPIESDNTGLHKQIAKKLMFFAILTTALLTVTAVIVLENELSLLVKLFETCTTIIHVSAKFYIVLRSKNHLYSLIDQTKFFWRIEELEDEHYKNTVEDFRLIKRIILWFITIGSVTILTFNSKAFFGILPLTVWSPKTYSFGYWIIAVIQWYFFFSVGFLVLGFDALFVACCYNLQTQFKILNARIRSTDFTAVDIEDFCNHDELNTAVAKYASYHEFLLKYGETLQQGFTNIFLPQYSIALLSFCVELYNVLDENTDKATVAQSLLYFASLVLQFALYCFPLAAVTMETEDISLAIYDCNWYMSTSGVRQKLLFMLMRSQRPLRFSAGGLAYMNRETFTNVFRMSMSFLTFMKTMG